MAQDHQFRKDQQKNHTSEGSTSPTCKHNNKEFINKCFQYAKTLILENK